MLIWDLPSLTCPSQFLISVLPFASTWIASLLVCSAKNAFLAQGIHMGATPFTEEP